MIKALKRLSPQESYDRVYRIRRAMQCSVTHKLLPKEEQTKPEEVRLKRFPAKKRIAKDNVWAYADRVSRISRTSSPSLSRSRPSRRRRRPSTP